MNNLPPGCDLSNEPGQHEPPDWCYMARVPYERRFGWDYEALAAWTDERNIRMVSWDL